MNTIKEAIEDLINDRKLPVDAAVDRHFGPSFRQRTNGKWDDRNAFRARIVQFRELVEHCTITVLDEFFHDSRYAERHVVDLVKSDGTRIVQEIYLFAQRDPDGRLNTIEESTMLLEP